MQMITFIITSLATGSTVIIGQHIGEKKLKAAGDTVGTTIILFTALGIILTILLEIFAGNIASLLKVPADLLCVGVLHMDVAGAALATITAQLVSVTMSVFVLRRQKLPISFSREQCRVYSHELRRILNVGVPIALQEAMVQISFLVVNSIINNMGLMQSAGYGVAQKLTSFIMLIPSAAMQSVSAFVAQNIGARQNERAKKGFFTAMITGCTIGIVIFLAGFFGGA